jgi:tRNA threonylcarbamoyl adenosine modification protein (Sua5/YciO/YrdC/YwlC family)
VGTAHHQNRRDRPATQSRDRSTRHPIPQSIDGRSIKTAIDGRRQLIKGAVGSAHPTKFICLNLADGGGMGYANPMAQTYTLHPTNPQIRTIDTIRDALRNGAVMLYPTDTVYAIGCDLNSKSAIDRVRQIKQMANDKPLTFLCPSLADIAQYAVVSDGAYRLMRRLIPGPYTFVLPTTKLVPKLVMHPKRKTTGIRVPENPICLAIMEALGNPIISTSAYALDQEEEFESPRRADSRFELFDCWEKMVDMIIDSDTEPSGQLSTMIDLTGDEPEILRQGNSWETVAALI